MELVEFNEIYGNFNVLKTTSDIDDAVLIETADYLIKRLNLNYKDLYEDNKFFQVLIKPTNPCTGEGCESCLGDLLKTHCCMCEQEIGPANRPVYSIMNDKLEISEVKVPICEDCYEKHKVFPIGTLNKFICEMLHSYMASLISQMNGKEIQVFLVC